jgi:DNA-binding NarL/FixJ family response regulator
MESIEVPSGDGTRRAPRRARALHAAVATATGRPGAFRERTGQPVVLVAAGRSLPATALSLALRAEGVDARGLSATGILAEAGQHPSALVLLDPAPSGGVAPSHPADLVAALRGQGNPTVMVGGTSEDPAVAASVAAGAVGALPWSVPIESLLHCLAEVAGGRPVMSEGERGQWLTRHQHHQDRRRRLDRLSPVDLDLLDRLALGHRASAAACGLALPMTTVRIRIRHILRTLGVATQMEAVALLLTEARPRVHPC